MYGSAFTIVTVRPRASSNAPIDAEATPLPRDDTTPPVTKMNLVLLASLLMTHLHPRVSPPRCPRSSRQLQVFRSVHLDQSLRGAPLGDAYRNPVFEGPQLLQLFACFERRRRERCEAHQDVAAIRIHADVPPPERLVRRPRPIAIERDGASREVERTPVASGD